MKTAVLLAVPSAEHRKLASWFSTGFWGLEEVKFLPFTGPVPQPSLRAAVEQMAAELTSCFRLPAHTFSASGDGGYISV